MDQAHKDRKAELEKQLKEGSKDPNVKTELEAINKLEAGEDTGANDGADVKPEAPKTGASRPSGNAQRVAPQGKPSEPKA